MKLREIEKEYEIGFIHNPKHFQSNSFEVEYEGRRLVLVAVVKRNVRKHFRIVGILKPHRN